MIKHSQTHMCRDNEKIIKIIVGRNIYGKIVLMVTKLNIQK